MTLPWILCPMSHELHCQGNSVIHIEIMYRYYHQCFRGRLLSDSYRSEAIINQMGVVSDEEVDKRLNDKEDSLPLRKSYYWTRQLMKAEEADSHRYENVIVMI